MTREQTDHLGDLVAGVVDGQLDHRSRELALGHLAQCDGCRSEVTALREMRHRLLQLGDPVRVPAGLADRLVMSVPQQRDPLPAVWAPRTRRGPRAAAFGVVLAAGVGVCLVTTGVVPGRERPGPRLPLGPAGVGTQQLDVVPISSVSPAAAPRPEASPSPTLLAAVPTG